MSKQPVKPKALLEAVGDLAVAISPHYMDRIQREKIAAAMHVLVDHIIAYAAAKQWARDEIMLHQEEPSP